MPIPKTVLKKIEARKNSDKKYESRRDFEIRIRKELKRQFENGDFKKKRKKKTGRKPGQGLIYTTEMIIKALAANGGLVSHAAKSLGVSHSVINYRMNHGFDKEELRKAQSLIKEAKLDETEDIFFKKIREGDVQCILHHLKTQGKSRGFGLDDKNISVKNNLEWKIEIVHNADETEAIDITTDQKEIEYADNSDPPKV